MSFQQGLSGLSAASKALEVTGNNIANANTVGFKQSNIRFEDVFANSLNGTGGSQVGIGVKASDVVQQFTQGNITSTNNALDVAINGNGFFRMSNNGSITYTRNGQFTLDKTGYIVNSNGDRLTGYGAGLTTGAIQEIQIDTKDQTPQQTGTVSSTLNLDSRSAALPSASFDPNDPDTYTHSTSANIYDSLGNVHVLQSYFVKTGAGAWDVFATVDGSTVGYTAPAAPVPVAQMAYGTSGINPTMTPATPTINAAVTTGAAALNFTLDYSKSTQFGSTFSVNALSQDGFSSGRLSGFSIDETGAILGRYTNGQSSNLGQLVLSNFTNANGLNSIGGNQWVESSASGPALTGAPNTGSLGVIQPQAVEDSNVDLTAELVAMINTQRYYQANAQTIKTQDQIQQTLVNLR